MGRERLVRGRGRKGKKGGKTHAVGGDGEVSGSLVVKLDGKIDGDVGSNVVVLLYELWVSMFSPCQRMEPWGLSSEWMLDRLVSNLETL